MGRFSPRGRRTESRGNRAAGPIPVWRFPAKRLLLAVTPLEQRFPGDAPGNLVYMDFRSAESKETKRQKGAPARPTDEGGLDLLIKGALGGSPMLKMEADELACVSGKGGRW